MIQVALVFLAVLPQDASPRPVEVLWRIGDTESGIELTGIAGFAVLPSGGFVIGQPVDHQAWRFDDRGRPAARLGREGRGPGEFGNIASVFAVGDTVVVRDDFNAHMFHRDEYVATLPRLALEGDQDSRSIPPHAHLGGADYALVAGPGLARLAGRPTRVWRWNSRTGAHKPIAVIQHHEGYRPGVDPETGLTVYAAQPVDFGDRWIALPNIPALAVLVQAQPGNDREVAAQLAVIHLTGDTIRTLHFAGRVDGIDEKLYDGHVDSLAHAAARGRPFPIAQVRRAFDAGVIRYPAQPLFDRMVADETDGIWLGRGSFGKETRRWVHYDLRGSVRTVVELPTAWELLGADGSALWVKARAETDETILIRAEVR